MRSLLIIMFVASVLLSSCKTRIGDNNNVVVVQTEMMQPTLNPKQKVIVDILDKNFDYGDIVRYAYKDEFFDVNDFYRIIGLPGDTVSLKNNTPIINGKENKSVYIGEAQWRTYQFLEFEETLPNNKKIRIYKYKEDMETDENSNAESVVVPPDHYYLLGDSRSLALDSRFVGAIPIREISAKVVSIEK